MQTVDLSKLHLKSGHLLLDAGCGAGRHITRAATMPGVNVVGLDMNLADLRSCRQWLEMIRPTQTDEAPEPSPPDSDRAANGRRSWLILNSSLTELPFKDCSFEAVICTEVLEHIPEADLAVRELVRVLKPGGRMAVSVPRFFPERICWALSKAYHREPGGHIRIYRTRELRELLENSGLSLLYTGYRHALHVPYWWLKCLVGPKNERSRAVNLYRTFLEWDIMKRPFITAFLEKLLNPVLGKSVVMYLCKTNDSGVKNHNEITS